MSDLPPPDLAAPIDADALAADAVRARFDVGTALLFGATIFTSAFLLFQVQPLIARFILPWFGASPGVWATCMLFFQLLLLGGYAYAHLLVSRVPLRRQALVHGALLLLAALTLPITPDASLQPEDGEAPIARILLVLLSSVGMPYLLLASTGPLLQGWLASLRPGRSPYRYYALSNVGSLLALLSYPFIVERAFRLEQQTLGWSLAYVGFAVLCGACAWRLRGVGGIHAAHGTARPGTGARPAAPEVALWLLLAACGSALLLATTNQLCLDIAAVPFLWILPLSLYLLTFILCFDSDRWYRRPLFAALSALALLAAVRALSEGVDLDIRTQVLLYGGALFVLCMCCHGELARRRPSPHALTLYFLVIAIGGALGGFFVAVVAPRIFSGFYEYPLLLVLTAGLVWGLYLRSDAPARGGASALPWFSWRRVLAGVCWALACGIVIYGLLRFLDVEGWLALTQAENEEERFAPWRAGTKHIGIVAVLLLLIGVDARRWARKIPFLTWWSEGPRLLRVGGAAVAVAGLVVLISALGWLHEKEDHYIRQARNFYGVLRIREDRWRPGRERRTLYNGRIDHGFQFLGHPEWPVSYYGPSSGLGLAIRRHPQREAPGRAFRIGVVGLGSGTIAAYANADIHPLSDQVGYVEEERRSPPDSITYYEINPLVEEWAESEFRYLSDARARGAQVEVHMGDARIVLERQARTGALQGFDVLALDAFTGDAIPIHLLTVESVELYLRHLKPDGILAIHVSNLYLDLVPVVRRIGEALGKAVLSMSNDDDVDRGVDSSDWVLLTNNVRFQQLEVVSALKRPLPPAGPLWTDDWSSLFDVLASDDEEERDVWIEEDPAEDPDDGR